MVPCRKLGGAASTVSCPMTMILCGWIVLVLQIQSVFNCQSNSDSCCPDDDDCCNDGLDGCCKENWKYYVPGHMFENDNESPPGHAPVPDECLCWPSSRKDGMCHLED